MTKKILIIEDDAVIQKMLTEPLTAEGYEVATAFDGVDGITKFQ